MMIQGSSTEDAVSPDVAKPHHETSLGGGVKARLITYLAQLGVSEPLLQQTLASECLQRARRRAAPGSEEELLRRSLEEAQRRFDHAAARALNLTGTKDFHQVVGARAAVLLGCIADIGGNHLFQADDHQPEISLAVRAALPLPTPPESHLAMPVQPISFFFSRSRSRTTRK